VTMTDVSNIEDRGVFRKDLMRQLAETNSKVERMDRRIDAMQQRDDMFMRLFSNLGGEIRVLNGHLTMHQMELRQEMLDPVALQQQADMMSATLGRITVIMDSDRGELFMQTIERASEPARQLAPERDERPRRIEWGEDREAREERGKEE
jgi:hypothetical protein